MTVAILAVLLLIAWCQFVDYVWPVLRLWRDRRRT